MQISHFDVIRAVRYCVSREKSHTSPNAKGDASAMISYEHQIKLLPKTRNVSDPFQFPSSAKCTSYANFLAISPFLPPLEVWSLYSAGHGIWIEPKKRHQRQRIHDWHWCFLINSMFRTSVHDRFELPRVKLQQMYWGNPGKIDFGSSDRELTMTLSNYLFPTFFCLNSMASFNISSRE